MRPGKPLAFGSFEGIPLIGLPGNPVSAYVGCRVFVLPVVDRLAGRPHPPVGAVRGQPLRKPVESDGRESYLRAVVKEERPAGAALTGHQGSGNFSLWYRQMLY
jgi:molybdopterin molybdotransferase